MKGTMKPIAAVYCIVKPHMSKIIVKMLTVIVAQTPHLLFFSNPITAVNPKKPSKKNIRLII